MLSPSFPNCRGTSLLLWKIDIHFNGRWHLSNVTRLMTYELNLLWNWTTSNRDDELLIKTDSRATTMTFTVLSCFNPIIIINITVDSLLKLTTLFLFFHEVFSKLRKRLSLSESFCCCVINQGGRLKSIFTLKCVIRVWKFYNIKGRLQTFINWKNNFTNIWRVSELFQRKEIRFGTEINTQWCNMSMDPFTDVRPCLKNFACVWMFLEWTVFLTSYTNTGIPPMLSRSLYCSGVSPQYLPYLSLLNNPWSQLSYLVL